MATCTITYSEAVARRAVHAFFWRRFKTPLGALYLLSLPLLIAIIVFVYSVDGPNWFVGAFGLILVMNVLIQGTFYFSLPKAFARRLLDPANRTADVETSSEGVRVASGRSAAVLAWAKFPYVWIYEDFVILAAKPPLMRFTFLPTDGMTPDVRRDLETASEGRTIT